MPRMPLVPAPVGMYGPIARQNAGSSGGGYAPPALGLPSTTNSSTAKPMPRIPVSACSAMVNAPTANTMNVPKPASVQYAPLNAPRIGPTISAPPSPDAIEYASSAPS